MKVRYFAWLRERLNRDEEFVDPPSSVQTVSDLMDWLSERDEAFALATAKRSTIRAAINAELVEHDTSLDGANEVAFFPPMTGG